MVVVLEWGDGGRLPVMGGTDVILAHQLPEKPAEGHAPSRLFDEKDHQLGPGASTRKVSWREGLGYR